MSPTTFKDKIFAPGCALAFTAGLLLAGAETTDPAWWPWANLAGGALFITAALAHRLHHRPAPWRQ